MSEEKGVNNVKEALQGAMDIIAEMILMKRNTEHIFDRQLLRKVKLSVLQRMQRHRASTRCIMSLRRL